MERLYTKIAGYTTVVGAILALEWGINVWGVGLPVSPYQGPVLMTGVMIGVKYAAMVFVAALVAVDFLSMWRKRENKELE